MENNHSTGEKLTTIWEIVSSTPPQNTQELWKEHQRIREVLDSISGAPSHGIAHGDRTQFIGPFVKWAGQKGIVGVDAVGVNDSKKGGLCLEARRDLAPEEIPIRVPEDVLLSADCAESTPSLRAILENDEVLKAMDNVALVMVLSHEVLRTGKSEWHPYIQLLPPSFSTPLFYSLEQFQQLRPSPCFHEAMMIYRAVARQFVYFSLRIIGDCKWLKEQKRKRKGKGGVGAEEQARDAPFSFGVFTASNFTFHLYKWCVSVVSTRINKVPSRRKANGEETSVRMIPALIPFIDLANHEYSREGDPSSGSVYYYAATKEVHLQIRSYLRSEEEVFIHYGERTNSEFLIHNGFVPDAPNPGNTYQLRIGLPKSSPDFDRKIQHLNKSNLKRESEATFLLPLQLAQTTMDPSLWEFARVFAAKTVDELENADGSDLNSKAEKFLRDRLTLLLKSYEGLKEPEPGENEEESQSALAIWRLKSGEVEILKSQLELL